MENTPPLTRQQRREQNRQAQLARQANGTRSRVWKRLLLWGGVLAALVLAVWGVSRLGTTPPVGSSGGVDAVSDQDWIEGNRLAATTLIEYSDFQCPACGAFYPFVKQLIRDHGNDMRLVYRHYPLPQHQNAEAAARAAEAAGKQGKFWEMHDLLFERQPSWSELNHPETTFADYAKELKLDMDAFQKDLDSSDVKDKVKSSGDSGLRAGVNSTPTFFLNGKALSLQGFKDLDEAVTDAIKNTK